VKQLMSTLSVMFVVIWIGVFLSNYGSRWTLSRNMTPITVISDDGRTYPDGTPVDVYTQGIMRSSNREELSLILWGGVFLMMAWVIRVYRTAKAKLIKLELSKQKLREYRKQLEEEKTC
jgi:hypothetical protein